jgi:DNA-binding FadR family transcriptional regulator
MRPDQRDRIGVANLQALVDLVVIAHLVSGLLRHGVVMRDAISSVDATVETLRRLCASGETLPAERALAARLGIKRHQLRRAIAVLRQRGEWRLRARRDTVSLLRPELRQLVHDTSPAEVLELRLALEPTLARLAALRASPAEVVGLRQALPRSDGGGRAADIAFHDRIAATTRNGLAVALLRLIGEIGRDSRLQLQLPPFTLQQETSEHRAILDAIAARDPDAAEQAMREHLASAQRWMMRGLATSAA